VDTFKNATKQPVTVVYSDEHGVESHLVVGSGGTVTAAPDSPVAKAAAKKLTKAKD